jgi:Promethin
MSTTAYTSTTTTQGYQQPGYGTTTGGTQTGTSATTTGIADIAIGAAATSAQRAKEITYKASGRVRRTLTWLIDTIRMYGNRYPPLAALLTMFSILAAIPVITFAVFATVSFGTLGTVAAFIVTAIESGLLMFAASVLGVILFLCGGASLVTVSTLTLGNSSHT